MSISSVNNTIVQSLNTATIKAESITRTMNNTSGVSINPFQPIVNAGWDDASDSMFVRLPNSTNDVVLGVTISGITVGFVQSASYVSSGLMIGVNTSSWNINDFIYAKTDG